MRGVDNNTSPRVAGIDTHLLEARPSIVFKFGFDLITDDVQALMELVKNPFDAYTSQLSVKIKNQAPTGDDTRDIVP